MTDECDNCPDFYNPNQGDSDGNGIDDGCDCLDAADCDDANVCTFDECDGTGCANNPVEFGDVNGSGASGGAIQPNLDDILCVLAGFGNIANCPNGDLAPTTGPNACQGDGIINLDDILAVLSAFGGADPCNCSP